MLQEVEEGRHYWSKSGYECKVLHIGRHGQDCSIIMITYTNVDETFDSPPGVVWSLSEYMFLTRFSDSKPTSKN